MVLSDLILSERAFFFASLLLLEEDEKTDVLNGFVFYNILSHHFLLVINNSNCKSILEFQNNVLCIRTFEQYQSAISKNK